MVHRDKLDDAFLFVLGLATVGFSLTIEHLGFLAGVPVLLSTVALPFYVGFIRATVIRSSPTERVMGWVILVVSTFVMLALLISTLSGGSPIYLLVGLLGIPFALLVQEGLVRTYHLPLDHNRRMALAGSFAAGYLFTVLAWTSVVVINLVPFAQYGPAFVAFILGYLWPILFMFFVFVAVDRTCQTLLIGQIFLEDFEPKKRWADRAIERLGGNPFVNFLEFAGAASNFVHRYRAIPLTGFLSLLSFVAVTRFLPPVVRFAEWGNAIFVLVLADVLISEAFYFYLRIDKIELLKRN